MTTQKRTALEQVFNKYSNKAADYRREIANSNRPQPAKLFTERVAELALATLSA